jgi:glycine/D-amino acid oxidase-like deaminating enzyme
MNGFSGHGLQQSPAIGRGVAEHLLTGGWQSLDLSDLSIDRVISGKPFSEKQVV